MLEKGKNIEVVLYTFGPWIVYVRIDSAEQMYYAVLQHKDYGIAEEMFGFPFSQPTTGYVSMEEFIGIVEANLPPYIRFYKEQYFADLEEE